MDNIDKSTLASIARLSKLEIPQDQEGPMLGDLAKILDYAHMLDTIDTQDVPPCYHVLQDMTCPERSDATTEEDFKPADLLSNAPEQTGGMVKIPPLMESP
jgi:aspartyl-tRNA(Asn)/glutamyl-tRNA(Gln) amidotransferase subunit C